MIVCSCNALSESQVRAAARKGACSPEAAYAKLGCEVQCGTCVFYAQEVIDDERRDGSGGRGKSNVVRLRAAA